MTEMEFGFQDDVPAPAKPRETFESPIGDKQIAFYVPTEGQISQLARYVNVAQRAMDREKAADTVTPIARMLDILLSLIVDSDDRYEIEDGLNDGSVRLEDMTEALKAMTAKNQEKASKTGPKATRGRR